MRYALTSFRFIHTADIHLDSPLKGLTRQEGTAADRIRTATREAFEYLVGQALQEEVAFVIIAGDLYDGDWRDYQTGLFFVRQMGLAASSRVPSSLGSMQPTMPRARSPRRLPFSPRTVTTSPARKPGTLQLKELAVALHGQARQRDICPTTCASLP